MIKTLRITSIVAAVLAGILFVFPVVFGVRSDQQTEQFLNSAGAIARFRETTGNKEKVSGKEVSPLVKQAEAFAPYLNPPPKPNPVAQTPSLAPEIRPPVPVSAKFTLVGTSCYPSRPEMSLAFIDEPGKGLHWVRQSSEVGHLVIEQVKDGSVVVRDRDRTFEIVAEQRPAEINLLESGPAGTIGGKSALPPSDVTGAPEFSMKAETGVETPPAAGGAEQSGLSTPGGPSEVSMKKRMR